MRHLIQLAVVVSTLLLADRAAAQSGPYQYYPLSPCRVVDTRNPNSTNGGPVLGSNASRNFQMRGLCGVPTSAKAVSLNVTVLQPTAGSWLAVWPSGQTRPVVSMINFTNTDPSLANGIIVGLSTNAQDLSVFNASGNVHVAIDVTGYFQ